MSRVKHVVKETFKSIKAKLKGYEDIDPTPIELPIHMTLPPTLQQQMAAMIRSQEFAQAIAARGFETAEEADDFDVGDDYDPSSPHELHWDPDVQAEVPRDVKVHLDRARSTFDDAVKKSRSKKKEDPKPVPPKTDEPE